MERCNVCQKLLMGRVKLDNHMKIHKTKECPTCCKMIPSNSFAFHQKRYHTEEMKMKNVTSVPETMHQSQLKKHLLSHECPYETVRESDLTKHLLSHLPKEKGNILCI